MQGYTLVSPTMTPLRLLALCALILPLTVYAQSVPRAFIPSGNGNATSSLAGDPGDDVTEIDGEGFLFRMQFDEQGDRPCFMIAHFWSAPPPDGVDGIGNGRSATFNVCRETNNPIQWDHLAGWTPFSLQRIGQPVTASALTLIDQISVIDNGRRNKRIKAVRVRFGDLKAWRLNQTPVNLNLTNYDSFRRPNADGSTFRDHSTCPSGKAAVGLLVYHRRNTGGNRYITGLKLKCAQVRRVDEQPTQTPPLQARPRRVINN